MVSLSFAFAIKLRCYRAQQIQVLVRCVHLALIRAAFSAPVPHQTGQELGAYLQQWGDEVCFVKIHTLLGMPYFGQMSSNHESRHEVLGIKKGPGPIRK